MNEFMLVFSFIALLAVIVFFVFMLERQARKHAEMVSFLIEQFRHITLTEGTSHQMHLDSLITQNLSQADRHQKQVDSLLGLIDELSSNANPGKITAQQYQAYQQYLIEQAKDIR